MFYPSDLSLSDVDENTIDFIERSNRPRKRRICNDRLDRFKCLWDEIEFYHPFRLSKRVVNIVILDIIINRG